MVSGFKKWKSINRYFKKPVEKQPSAFHSWVQTIANIILLGISIFATFWSVRTTNIATAQYKEQFKYQRDNDSVRKQADSIQRIEQKQADSVQLELIRRTILNMEAQTQSLRMIESSHRAAINFNMGMENWHDQWIQLSRTIENTGAATASKVSSNVVAYTSNGILIERKRHVILDELIPHNPLHFGGANPELRKWVMNVNWREHAPLFFKVTVSYMDFHESNPTTKTFYFSLPSDFASRGSLPHASKEEIKRIENWIKAGS